MPNAAIIGWGKAVPERVLTNHDLERMVDTNDEWIRSRTGIRERRIVGTNDSTTSLATAAAREALDVAGCTADDIDLIIVATSTPDYVFPSTACLLQAKLGIANCPAFDVQAVCSGFVYGLATADSFIRSGQYRRALVVGAEVFSRILDWNDRGTCVLFGDGAGAVVLAADARPGVHASVLHADGRHSGILSVPGNVCGGRIVGSPYLQMQGKEVFKFAVKVLDEVARETVAAAGMSLTDVDWLIPHQANVRIISHVGRKLGVPDAKCIVTVDRHANTSAASVPLALDAAVRDGRVKSGHLVLLQGVGGGFTWGATLVTM